MNTRAEIARSAADALERGAASPPRALVGFDGFIDSIIDVVDTRASMRAEDYTRIRTIPEYAARCAGAAGKSTNMELVVKEERFGGNGPLLAGALGRLGAKVTYIGAVGSEGDPGVLSPVYEELGRRCERVVPVARPARTDALEFEDGKLMLGKPANIQTVTWESLKRAVGLGLLRETVERATLVGMVNWVMMGGVESIWEGLISEVFPAISRRPRVFIDLSDPAKRTDSDVARALSILKRMNALTPVTLGLNLAEAERIAQVAGVDAWTGRGMSTMGVVVKDAAAKIRGTLGLSCVVIHPREGAGAADANGAAWIDGPFTATPKLSTGAGDHFNGGFAYAQVMGLTLEQCLAAGVAVSGAYVRDAESPTLTRLEGFLRDLPGPG